MTTTTTTISQHQQAIGNFGQGLINQVKSLGNQVSDGLGGSIGQATGTLAQGAFQGIGAGLGNLGSGILNPNMRLAGKPDAEDSSIGSFGGFSSNRGLLAVVGGGGGSSDSSSSGGPSLAQDALQGGVSLFPEAAMAVGLGSSISSSVGSSVIISSSSDANKPTRTLLHKDASSTAAALTKKQPQLLTPSSKDPAGAAGDMVVASSVHPDSSSSGSRSLQQVDFFAAPAGINDFVSQGVASGAFGTQLGAGGADLNSQIQAGLQALAGTGDGIGGNFFTGAANTGSGGLATLARMAGLGGAADVFNTGGVGGALGGLSSLFGGGGAGGGEGVGDAAAVGAAGGGAAATRRRGLGGLLSGIAHGLGGGRGGSNAAAASGGSSSNAADFSAASLAGLSQQQQQQYGGSNTMYTPFSQQQQPQLESYNLEQGSLGQAVQQGVGLIQGLAGAPQQQQQQNPNKPNPYMDASMYNQAFQQLSKIPGQAVGALAGFGTGLANQGIQATQTLGNQIYQQAGQNLANGQPILGTNQPMVVQGLGQDPNTYVIGGSDYNPGGAGLGQMQQLEQGMGSGLALPRQNALGSGQLVSSTNLRNQYAGGQLGTGGQFVRQPTQPSGVLDPTTGMLLVLFCGLLRNRCAASASAAQLCAGELCVP